ncbi:MAG TPA: tripartite tricarboxylate transporter substrate binding protein [Noviherbaspirillum sp.]|jgi:tripartite-type tricarboxylate transporter receptor subunit TctC|uniref:Bug family tripartite tricarboxylate transporter substrate binding protein n=1 Tax=Noviherbaspirillum sp. TaxID=1926288 RepID=UPI002DDD87FA|nr:tripartite tricarboxylate transporter substrate binding protein [Noviherbaspirillum sp.]HEV2610826.1 tripartite tricarboxylate transporter substrate binding protein [Noviherbaspirillum sp.]
MSFNRRKFNRLLLAGTGAVVAAPFVRAQGAWPNKPMRVIVPYAPGGFTDVMARLVSQHLSTRLGQPVLVENKPGGGSLIGVDAIAKSQPDGYTFGVVIAAYAANMTLYQKLPYAQKDLQPVSLIGVSPLVAAVNKDLPYKTAQQMIAFAKANPGKISYGSSGNGSAVHLSTELLKMLTGTYMLHIPYRGAAPALSDLIGGHIQLFMDAASGLIQPIKTGKVQGIGVASDKRLPALPDVPTFIEQGIKGFTGSTWAGMLAPTGTPPEVIKRVSDEIAQIVKLPDVVSRFETMGVIPSGSGPQEFDRFIEEEIKKWGNVIKTAKITAD